MRPSRRWYGLAALVATASIVVTAALGVTTAIELVRRANDFQRSDASGSWSVTVSEPGDYSVYYEYLSPHGLSGSVEPDFTVAVSAPDGSDVDVRPSDVTYGWGSRQAVAVGSFEAELPGYYEIHAEDGYGQLAFGRSIPGGWLYGFGSTLIVGGAVVGASAVLAIVVAVLRRRSRRRLDREGWPDRGHPLHGPPPSPSHLSPPLGPVAGRASEFRERQGPPPEGGASMTGEVDLDGGADGDRLAVAERRPLRRKATTTRIVAGIAVAGIAVLVALGARDGRGQPGRTDAAGPAEAPGAARGGGQAGQDGAGQDGVDLVGITTVVVADDHNLTVRTDPVPVEVTGPECRAEVTPQVEESPNEVMVTVEVRADRPQLNDDPARDATGYPIPWEGCTVEPREVTVPLAAPVGQRVVTDLTGSRFWFRDGRWVGCDHVVMVCVTDPASCDNSTLRDSIANADVPAHFYMDSRCEEPFAVVDVDYGAGACPPTGEPGPNPCAGQIVHRQYWRIQDQTWDLIATDDAAGCGHIHDLAPDFPTHLCQDLPAIPPRSPN